VKIILLQKVILPYGKKSLFWSLIIFGYLSFTTLQGQKIGFNSCECIQFLNKANFHAFHVWGKRILSCNDTTVFLHSFFLFLLLQRNLFHSSYVIKPPQPSSPINRSSAFYREPSASYSLHQNASSALHLIPVVHCTHEHDLLIFFHLRVIRQISDYLVR